MHFGRWKRNFFYVGQCWDMGWQCHTTHLSSPKTSPLTQDHFVYLTGNQRATQPSAISHQPSIILYIYHRVHDLLYALNYHSWMRVQIKWLTQSFLDSIEDKWSSRWASQYTLKPTIQPNPNRSYAGRFGFIILVESGWLSSINSQTDKFRFD